MREFRLVYRVGIDRVDGKIIPLAVVRFGQRASDHYIEIEVRHYLPREEIEQFDLLSRELLFDGSLPKIRQFLSNCLDEVYREILATKRLGNPQARVSRNEVIEKMTDDLRWSIVFYEVSNHPSGMVLSA